MAKNLTEISLDICLDGFSLEVLSNEKCISKLRPINISVNCILKNIFFTVNEIDDDESAKSKPLF